MRLPKINLGPGRCLVLSRFLLSRLRSNTQAKKFVAELEAAHKALKSAQLALNDAGDAVLDARGPVAEVDALAQELLTTFQLDVLKVVGKDYNALLYRKFLPKGLTEARKAKGADMAGVFASMALVLDAEGKTSPLASYAPKFADIGKKYAGPLADLKKAQDAEILVNNKLNEARRAWVLAYETVYGHLRAEFAGRKGFVETFFMPVESPKKDKAASVSAEPAV